MVNKMKEHISYAMRNEEATQALICFNSPSSLLDWTHVAIEWIFIIGIFLTVIHALRYSKKTGQTSAIYTLIGALIYGLVMDILSYYTVENFWHGEFSVMFLYNKLPLYIILLYPALIYHIYMTIRRYEFSPVVEAVSVGFFGGLLYMIFDNFGPQVGWWIWDRTDPTTWPYLNSVPLTSYGWFFLYTGAFAWLARKICWDWVEKRKSKAKIYLGIATIPVTTIILGTLLFTPYSMLAKNIPPWDRMSWNSSLETASFVHAVSFFLAGLVFLFSIKKPRAPRDKLLMVFPLIFLAGHLYMYIAKYHLFIAVSTKGLTPDGLPIGNLTAVIVAMVAGTAILLASHPLEE